MLGIRSRKTVAGPESLNAGAISSNPEVVIPPDIRLVLAGRKQAVEAALTALENVRKLAVGTAAVAEMPGIRIMKGVPRPEVVQQDVLEQAVSLEAGSNITLTDSRDDTEAAINEAKTVALEEHRARYLLEMDAHRQVEEAFNPQQTLSAEVKDSSPVALIPDVNTAVTASPMVIEARERVQVAHDEAARLAAANELAERQVEAQLLASKRAENRSQV